MTKQSDVSVTIEVLGKKLTREEAESLYRELGKALGKDAMPRIPNRPYDWGKTPYTAPADPIPPRIWYSPGTGTAPPSPFTVICEAGSA